jgi:hypothetical protein
MEEEEEEEVVEGLEAKASEYARHAPLRGYRVWEFRHVGLRAY